MVILNKN